MGRLKLAQLAVLVAVLGILLGSASGCLMCCNPQYDAYPAYGGAMQRTDRYHGRVGSAFEPAGFSVVPPVEEPVDNAEEVPTEADPAEAEPMPDGDSEPMPERFQPAEPAPPLETRIFSALRND